MDSFENNDRLLSAVKVMVCDVLERVGDDPILPFSYFRELLTVSQYAIDGLDAGSAGANPCRAEW